jgi:hypothetical protein
LITLCANTKHHSRRTEYEKRRCRFLRKREKNTKTKNNREKGQREKANMRKNKQKQSQ